MILGNLEIHKAMRAGLIVITPPPILPEDGKGSAFDTTALNLHLADTISFPKEGRSYTFDLTRGKITETLKDMYRSEPISATGGFALQPNRFALANTREHIELAIRGEGEPCYAARVEGRSSFARCGLLVHFTAPTIHAGFNGTITLELINLGDYPIMLYPDMEICQLVFEQVKGEIALNPSQFHGQMTPEGTA